MPWPLALLGNVAVGLGFAGQQWYESRQRGRKPTWSGALISSAMPTAGFAAQQMLGSGYQDDEWIEFNEAQGFNPRRWGKDVGGSPYGMGY